MTPTPFISTSGACSGQMKITNPLDAQYLDHALRDGWPFPPPFPPGPAASFSGRDGWPLPPPFPPARPPLIR